MLDTKAGMGEKDKNNMDVRGRFPREDVCPAGGPDPQPPGRKVMKKWMKHLPLVLMTLMAFSTALGALPLRVLYTGDTHGAYETTTDFDTGFHRGGYLMLEHHLNRLREEAPRSLYLDSGDQQTGSIFSSLVDEGVPGGAVTGVFNRLGLDASVFGNHEFDFSYSNAKDLARRAEYPFVCTNLLDKSTRRSVGGDPYAIIERDGLNIGILGITLEILPEKVKAENTRSLIILPPGEAIERHLDELDEATDLIIVLTHQGFKADSLMAESLDDRVDLIIGGHDHIATHEPCRVNGIYLLYPGSHLQYLGRADLQVENDRITSISNRLIPLESEQAVPPTPLGRYIEDKVREVEIKMAEVIGHIHEDWIPDKYRSTVVSRWVANSLKREYRDIYEPDLAIINNGGLRKTIPAGPVTLRDMHELLPFNNTVVVFSCHGRDILTLDGINVLHAVEKPHDICQRTPLEEPLDEDAVYRVVSHDYVVGQWDKYLGFEPFDVYDTGEPIIDPMIRQFRLQFSPPDEEGRD